MKYAIISIDDSRSSKKDYIRAVMHLEEADVDYTNGKDSEQLMLAKKKWHSVATPGPYKAGEFGIFYSVLNCLEYGAADDGILYFEDDAVPAPDIHERLTSYLNELPASADVFALWSPENQKHDYLTAIGYNNSGEPQYGSPYKSIFEFGHHDIVRLWQGYGNVSMYFSKNGCRKMLRYIQNKGFFSPIDCLICIACHGGYLNGYALRPGVTPLINYDWSAPTTIHQSRWGMIEELI